MRTPRSADDVFAALADPTRRELLTAIGARGSATATALASDVPVTRQAIVKHLGVLDEAGLVSGQRHGREVRYAVRTQRLTEAARWLEARAAEWDARLERIKRLAEGG
ncbi:ArsR/SmtB family transcription factor [Spirilliplanes yamanashiensis]|uniref:Transcriptional regulator n=1 Tax=Spirilliplanes yamanashiensis TaxID=42233 RepID=A0A8J4DMK2_9ACTN|nr:metalloregulator ArsR/SmtB family transcription factor [Spirilliplanes yamanashiensis]MDP9815194.1 DNA-binding transcriptional ArsR family regulator [Spirilliplanes yamanashiensis]GIJ06538.1 transcriptional regulator [Spirilliplanes yamanashiensis]